MLTMMKKKLQNIVKKIKYLCKMIMKIVNFFIFYLRIYLLKQKFF